MTAIEKVFTSRGHLRPVRYHPSNSAFYMAARYPTLKRIGSGRWVFWVPTGRGC